MIAQSRAITVFAIALATAIGDGVALAVTTMMSNVVHTTFAAELGSNLWLGRSSHLIVGALEGAILGTSQWLILQREWPRLSPGRYIGASSAALAVVWFLTGLASEYEPGDQTGWVWALIAANGILAGVGLGVAQLWSLRGMIAREVALLVASCIGWVFAMASAALVTEWLAYDVTMTVWVISSACVGFTSGAVAGIGLGLVVVRERRND